MKILLNLKRLIIVAVHLHISDVYFASKSTVAVSISAVENAESLGDRLPIAMYFLRYYTF
jgi:hypothetical protein